jgi:hypothetical protein
MPDYARPVDFTIGRHRRDGDWEEFETVTAPNPAAAFSRWVHHCDGVEAGQYGLRASDSDAWEWLFRADSDGLHPEECVLSA